MSPVEEMRIMEDVRQVKARYFRFTDSKNWAELATIFCKQATLGGVDGPAFCGAGTIVDLIRRGTDRVTTVHHGHCHEVWVDSANEARGIIAFEDLGFSHKSDELVMHGYGHYHEVYRLEDGAWRIWECKIARKAVVDRPR
jgi:hypothetical protein